jgi:hypothetical protein
MNDRRSIASSLAAIAAALAATSCCMPLLPFVVAAGTAASSAWLLAFQPFLLGTSVLLIAFGFYQGWRVKQCGRRPSAVSAVLLWISTALVGMMLLFPQILASLLAG